MGNLHFSLQVVASMIRYEFCGTKMCDSDEMRNVLAAIVADCRMYDKDRNGTISFQEFQGLVRRLSTQLTTGSLQLFLLFPRQKFPVWIKLVHCDTIKQRSADPRHCCCSINSLWTCTPHSTNSIQIGLDH